MRLLLLTLAPNADDMWEISDAEVLARAAADTHPFLVRDDVTDPREALLAAVRDCAAVSPEVEGEESLEEAMGLLDWTDVVHQVPAEIWVRHGLTPLEEATLTRVAVWPNGPATELPPVEA